MYERSISEPFALLLLGGSINDLDVYRKKALGATLILAADSGANHARRMSLLLDAIVGDLDSISPETLRHFTDQEKQHSHPCAIIKIPEQDHNDFEKALMYLSERWNGSVRILGLTGGRTDHTLSNFSVMLRYSDTFSNIEAFDTEFVHSFLTIKNNYRSFDCPVGTMISLMPFGEAVEITTENLQYPLTNETLRLGEREGLSNISTASPVSISIERGALLVSMQGSRNQ